MLFGILIVALIIGTQYNIDVERIQTASIEHCEEVSFVYPLVNRIRREVDEKIAGHKSKRKNSK